MKQNHLKLLSRLLSVCALPITAATANTIDFGKDVYPILNDQCLRCHAAPYEDARGRTKNPKGGLRLDTPEWIMKGYVNDEGETEKVLFPGDADASEFYTLTILPEDHDDIMPSSGDPLTKAETEILKAWINQGAKFGDFKAPTYVNPKSKQAAQK
ncbi:MAG: c-type cytochrome domain-containing protein [Coraliomargarita sp.]